MILIYNFNILNLFFISVESQFVFNTKAEALKILKKHKDARLKEFFNEDDAIKYAQTGFELVQHKYNDVRSKFIHTHTHTS